MSMLIVEVLRLGQDMSQHILWTALAAGLILWLFGSWGHRFWIVLFTTVMAGIAGLMLGPQVGLQRLVGGLLLAVTAGALALSVIRMVMFVLVGLLLMVLMKLVPAWDEPLVTFIGGGLLGVMLSRFWMAVLTSLLGTLVMAHAGLALLSRIRKLDVIGWVDGHGPVINWAIGAIAVMGVLMQYYIQKYLKGLFKGAKDDDEGKDDKKDKKGKKAA